MQAQADRSGPHAEGGCGLIIRMHPWVWDLCQQPFKAMIASAPSVPNCGACRNEPYGAF